MIAAPFVSRNEPSYDILFEGITFVSADLNSIQIANIGNITFQHCTWKNHNNLGPINIFHSSPEIGRRRQRRQLRNSSQSSNDSTTSNDSNDSRRASSIQSKQDTSNNNNGGGDPTLYQLKMVITYRHCLFYNNTVTEFTEESARKRYGIITVDDLYHDLVIVNTTFWQNYYNDPMASPIGYAISFLEYLNNTLTLENNCFIDNTFLGPGMILLNRSSILQQPSVNNYVRPTNQNAVTSMATTTNGGGGEYCPFVYSYENQQCTPADLTSVSSSSSCYGVNTSETPLAPTPTAPAAPVPSPPTTPTSNNGSGSSSGSCRSSRYYASSVQHQQSILVVALLVVFVGGMI